MLVLDQTMQDLVWPLATSIHQMCLQFHPSNGPSLWDYIHRPTLGLDSCTFSLIWQAHLTAIRK